VVARPVKGIAQIVKRESSISRRLSTWVLVGKTASYAEQQIELRTDAFWRRHWRWAVPGVLGAWLMAGAIGLLIPVSFPMWVVYPLLVLAVLSAMRPYFYGTYHLEMATEAEAWTSKELRKACGPGWHVVDGIWFLHARRRGKRARDHGLAAWPRRIAAAVGRHFRATESVRRGS
jgi:hypothetical protein